MQRRIHCPHLHHDKARERLAEQQVKKLDVQPCQAHCGGVLVVHFVEAVEFRVVHHPVPHEEGQVLKEQHD